MADFKNTREGRNVAQKYADILHLSRPEPPVKHPRMALSNRAKIFSPFAALRGFDDEIFSEGASKLLVKKVELSDEEKNDLSDKLLQVKKGMKVVVRYFVKTAESTGKYISLTGTVVMIDPVYPKEDDTMEIVVKQKRAAAYCRVSTGMECQEGSYEIQKSYFTELLSNNPDEELVKVYADEGSGRSTQGRPEFRQMIQDCVDGKIDIIYTKSISRFSRNMLDCVTVVRQLKELGIPVIFEKEGINTMDGQSELFFHILAIIAEEESKSIGENVRAGIAYLHDQGIPTGRVTYGFRRVNKQGEWRIEESEARRVRYAFDQAAKGVCYADIRACLDKMEDEENTGVSWSQNRNRLPNMLKNVAYMGDYWTDCYYTAYGKNGHRYSKRNRGERAQVHLEDHHEGIVSREQFERVQTMIQMGLLHSGRKKYNDEQQKVLNDPKWQ